jgi:hypothetical protein
MTKSFRRWSSTYLSSELDSPSKEVRAQADDILVDFVRDEAAGYGKIGERARGEEPAMDWLFSLKSWRCYVLLEGDKQLLARSFRHLDC